MKKSFSMKQFLKTSKGYIIAILLSLFVIAELFSFDAKSVATVILSVGTALVLDIGVALYQKRERIFPDGAIITGLIIGLILSSSTHWYVTVLTTAIAILSKHLFKQKRKPIFNPAAFGLFVSTFFASEQSWWGSKTAMKKLYKIYMHIDHFFEYKYNNKEMIFNSIN